jgi:hypothetical protein
VRAGVGSVMSAFVAYPGWDPSGRAAGFSPVMLGYLRDTLGFQGLVVTDALIMAGATARQAEAPATASAVAAGCDALLYPEDFAGVIAALDRAVGGVIPAARAEAALAHYQHAVDMWGHGPDQGDPDIAAHEIVLPGAEIDRPVSEWSSCQPKFLALTTAGGGSSSPEATMVAASFALMKAKGAFAGNPSTAYVYAVAALAYEMLGGVKAEVRRESMCPSQDCRSRAIPFSDAR